MRRSYLVFQWELPLLYPCNRTFFRSHVGLQMFIPVCVSKCSLLIQAMVTCFPLLHSTFRRPEPGILVFAKLPILQEKRATSHKGDN